MPVWSNGYDNPFYHNVNKSVISELNSRAKNVGARVRAGKNSGAIEWSYGKTAYGHVKAKGITLGFPGDRVISDRSGNLKLYNSRNAPRFPLLQSISVTNDGTLGSLLRGNFTFTYWPEMGSSGFNMGGIDEAFFTPGAEVTLSWGWSYGGPSCRQTFTGLVNNFNWSFNADLSMTATVSIVSAATISIGLSGDQSVTPKDDSTKEVEDPSQVTIAASNLVSVIDSDLGLGNQTEDPNAAGTQPAGATNTAPADPNAVVFAPPQTAVAAGDGGAAAGGGGAAIWQATNAGDVHYMGTSQTINKLLDYVGIGWPFQESSGAEEEVTAGGPVIVDPNAPAADPNAAPAAAPTDPNAAPASAPAEATGPAPVKTFWYTSIGRLVGFANDVIAAYEKGGNPAMSKVFKVMSDGNITTHLTDVKSAFPIDVIFPSPQMGHYGNCTPQYIQVAKNFVSNNDINISGILLGVDYIKQAYSEFIKETTTQTFYKNITKFFETILKRVNMASGDMYQLTPVLCEPPSNFDGKVEPGLARAILSIEDSNLSPSHTDKVTPFHFEANIFKPLVKQVSISSKPPGPMAAAAYVKARKAGGSNIEVQADAPQPTGPDVSKTINAMKKMTENFTQTGFNQSWCEAFRGHLTKYKKLKRAPGKDAHWLNKALYPVDFTVTIDGISGFRFGDVISTSLVPTKYNKAGLVFVVTKIDHKIDNGMWETTLSTAARLKMDGSTL
jgi:hypothetical protein